MTLVPAFEIGVWSAWILMLFVFLYIIMTVQVFKNDVGKKIAHCEEEKKLSNFVAVFFFILLIYSVFLPLKLGTIWFYTGLSIYFLGLIICTIAIVSVAATPLGEPFTKGVYRWSRNALSLGMLLTLSGVGVAAASWLYLLLSAIVMVITHFMVLIEERFCLGKFGGSYREYMNRTPRWIGIPKSCDWIEGKVNVGEKAGPGGITASRAIRWVFLVAGLSLIVAFVPGSVLPQWQESGEEPVVSQPPAQLVPTTMWTNLYSPASLLDGNPVPAGAVITAYDPGGVLCGEFTVVRPGQYGLMPVYADDPTTTWDEGAAPGETISLMVNGFPAQTIPTKVRWTSLGDLLRVDLVASTPPSRPQG